MTTSQYITWLLDRTGNTLSRADMLFNVNLAQNEIASTDCYFFRTKPDPYLTTTADTYTYTLAASVRRVARVYALATSANVSATWPFKTGYTSYGGYDTGFDYKSPQYVDRSSSPELDIPVDTVEASTPDTAGCQIIFPAENNPGTTTDKFLIEQYEWPTQLTSEAVSIEIPEGFRTKVLYYKVLRLMEEQEYGNASYSADREEKAMKEWLRFANRGARTIPLRTNSRDL